MLDADKSGSIDEQEAQAHSTVAQNFAAADKNADGSLSREEFNSAFTTTPPAAPQAETPSEPESSPR